MVSWTGRRGSKKKKSFVRNNLLNKIKKMIYRLKKNTFINYLPS